VTFAGFQPDVRPFLAAASVLGLPSYSEGLPRAVMEAFAAGVPVIGSDVPGVRALVRPGETGVVVPAGAPERLADAIVSTLRAPEGARSMAERARRLVEQEHGPERLVDELCAEYQALTRRAA
jgi:glycosyltransferase involved in cell wall biosynthesis